MKPALDKQRLWREINREHRRQAKEKIGAEPHAGATSSRTHGWPCAASPAD
jgi:hypothetical protein